MLQGLFRVLFLEIGRGLTNLAYGAHGTKARKMKNGSRYSIGAIVWSFLLILLVVTLIIGLALKPFDPLVLIAWVGFPVLYIAYFVWARKQEARLIQEACAYVKISEEDFDLWDEEEGYLPEKCSAPVVVPVGEWKCSCGRVNADYISSCVCGNTKRSQVKQ